MVYGSVLSTDWLRFPCQTTKAHKSLRRHKKCTTVANTSYISSAIVCCGQHAHQHRCGGIHHISTTFAVALHVPGIHADCRHEI